MRRASGSAAEARRAAAPGVLGDAAGRRSCSPSYLRPEPPPRPSGAELLMSHGIARPPEPLAVFLAPGQVWGWYSTQGPEPARPTCECTIRIDVARPLQAPLRPGGAGSRPPWRISLLKWLGGRPGKSLELSAGWVQEALAGRSWFPMSICRRSLVAPRSRNAVSAELRTLGGREGVKVTPYDPWASVSAGRLSWSLVRDWFDPVFLRDGQLTLPGSSKKETYR